MAVDHHNRCSILQHTAQLLSFPPAMVCSSRSCCSRPLTAQHSNNTGTSLLSSWAATFGESLVPSLASDTLPGGQSINDCSLHL